jgi:D-alanyl-D-alanine dipeptidase
MDAQGEMIDVYSPYDRYSAAPTYAYGLTKEAEANRMVLVEAMLGAGFSNCRDEWWHYSYGDAGWAVRAGETSCIYGLAELPESLTAEAELLHAQQLEGRPNPFDSLPSG